MPVIPWIENSSRTLLGRVFSSMTIASNPSSPVNFPTRRNVLIAWILSAPPTVLMYRAMMSSAVGVDWAPSGALMAATLARVRRALRMFPSKRGRSSERCCCCERFCPSGELFVNDELPAASSVPRTMTPDSKSTTAQRWQYRASRPTGASQFPAQCWEARQRDIRPPARSQSPGGHSEESRRRLVSDATVSPDLMVLGNEPRLGLRLHARF